LITSNEGHYDVYSKQDSTTFIYDINKEKFLESLDVFLHSFINPLFREELIRKELNLIKSFRTIKEPFITLHQKTNIIYLI